MTGMVHLRGIFVSRAFFSNYLCRLINSPTSEFIAVSKFRSFTRSLRRPCLLFGNPCSGRLFSVMISTHFLTHAWQGCFQIEKNVESFLSTLGNSTAFRISVVVSASVHRLTEPPLTRDNEQNTSQYLNFSGELYHILMITPNSVSGHYVRCLKCSVRMSVSSPAQDIWRRGSLGICLEPADLFTLTLTERSDALRDDDIISGAPFPVKFDGHRKRTYICTSRTSWVWLPSRSRENVRHTTSNPPASAWKSTTGTRGPAVPWRLCRKTTWTVDPRWRT